MKISTAIEKLQEIYNKYGDKYEIHFNTDMGAINSNCIVLDKYYDELYFSYNENIRSYIYKGVEIYNGENNVK